MEAFGRKGLITLNGRHNIFSALAKRFWQHFFSDTAKCQEKLWGRDFHLVEIHYEDLGTNELIKGEDSHPVCIILV